MKEAHYLSGAPPSWRRFLLVAVAMTLCASAVWSISAGHREGPANWVLMGSALAVAVLLGGTEEREAPPGPEPQPASTSRVLRCVGAGLALLGASALGMGTYLLAADWRANFDSGALLDVAGIVLGSAGLLLWERARGRRPGPGPAWSALELAVVAVVFALGVFLRFWRYETFPPNDGFCTIEEAQVGMGAANILQGWRPWEWLLDRWLPVPTFLLLGQTITAVRIPFTIVSCLTIVPFYLLLRNLVSIPAALFATAAFAVCRWHLTYSRYGHFNFATTLFIVVLLYLCVRAHRLAPSGRGLGLYPWIGFLTGYTLYAYAGYRGTVLFVSVFFAISLFKSWRWIRRNPVAGSRRPLKVQVVGLAMAALVFVAMAAPLVSMLKDQPELYFEAVRRTTGDKSYFSPDRSVFLRNALGRLEETARIFLHVGDRNLQTSYNVLGMPMFDPATGLLLVVGVAYTAVRPLRRLRGFFAFMFLTLMLLGSVFVQNLDFGRLYANVPLMFVLIAFFVDRLGQMVCRRLPGPGRKILAVAGLSVLGMAATSNYEFYFGRMRNDAALRVSYRDPYTVAIRYLHALPSDAYLFLMAHLWNFFLPSDYDWWRGNRVPGMVTYDLMPLLSGQGGPWSGRQVHLLIKEPFESEDLLDLVAEAFPGSRCDRFVHPEAPMERYMACQLQMPSSANGVLKGGATARYYRGDEASPFLERRQPFVDFGFTPNECAMPHAQVPCRAEWEGTWEVPRTGDYFLTADTLEAAARVFVDGRPASGPIRLIRGLHEVRVEARHQGVDLSAVRLQWTGPGSERSRLLRFGDVPGSR